MRQADLLLRQEGFPRSWPFVFADPSHCWQDGNADHSRRPRRGPHPPAIAGIPSLPALGAAVDHGLRTALRSRIASRRTRRRQKKLRSTACSPLNFCGTSKPCWGGSVSPNSIWKRWSPPCAGKPCDWPDARSSNASTQTIPMPPSLTFAARVGNGHVTRAGAKRHLPAFSARSNLRVLTFIARVAVAASARGTGNSGWRTLRFRLLSHA